MSRFLRTAPFTFAAASAVAGLTKAPQNLTAVPADDIRGLKPLIAPPFPWEWWLLAGALVLIGAGVAAYLLLKKRPTPTLLPPLPPHVRARQRLNAALDLLHDPREFCIVVSDTLRLYLEERFHLRAPERTTEEFLSELQSSPALAAGQKSALAGFLESCDLVKFARHEPTEENLRDLHSAALRLVEETTPDITEPVPA